MKVVWTETATLPCFERLKKDIKTEVLIIGGGMAGLLCAYMLGQEKVPYVLLEAERIAGGITKHTTAKITVQHGLVYHQILERYGVEKMQMYLDANLNALEEYRRICQKAACDFRERDAYVYSRTNQGVCEKEMDALEKIRFPAKFVQKLHLPLPVAGAVSFPKQAEFHPLKFLAEIVGGLTIYENTKVKEMIDHTAVTEYGKVTAKKIIVATHFPFLNKHGSFFLKMYQHRSYVMALEQAGDVRGMYVDESKAGLSFRNYKDLLLIGGGSHRTGKMGGNWAELKSFTNVFYPHARERYRWATQDCMTLDHMPYIGQYAKRTPGMYVATGFNKWGMTSAMVAAKILTDMILEKKSPYAEVFSPSRSIWHPQLAVNIASSTANLLTMTPKRCPHMGCALKWNPQEHSYDCPCHGSRFTEDGKLIDNPATGNLKNN